MLNFFTRRRCTSSSGRERSGKMLSASRTRNAKPSRTSSTISNFPPKKRSLVRPEVSRQISNLPPKGKTKMKRYFRKTLRRISKSASKMKRKDRIRNLTKFPEPEASTRTLSSTREATKDSELKWILNRINRLRKKRRRRRRPNLIWMICRKIFFLSINIFMKDCFFAFDLWQKKLLVLVMAKWNLGQVFNSRCGCTSLWCGITLVNINSLI